MRRKVLISLIFAICVVGLLLWFAAKPVLLELGHDVSVLNPFRSRTPERVADAFLRAASIGTCSPDLSEKLSDFVRKRPLPATDWTLVNRLEFPTETRLYYRLSGPRIKAVKNGRCLIAEVYVQGNGESRKNSGYGVEPGPCNANLSHW
jgi:hypothetical protein